MEGKRYNSICQEVDGILFQITNLFVCIYSVYVFQLLKVFLLLNAIVAAEQKCHISYIHIISATHY